MAGAVHISPSLFQAPCSLTEASDYTLFTFSRLSSLPEGLESSFCFEASWDSAAWLFSPGAASEATAAVVAWLVTAGHDLRV